MNKTYIIALLIAGSLVAIFALRNRNDDSPAAITQPGVSRNAANVPPENAGQPALARKAKRRVKRTLFRPEKDGCVVVLLNYMATLTADEPQATMFTPAETIRIGSLDWSPDGALGSASAILGRISPVNKKVEVRASAYPAFKTREDGARTFSFTAAFPMTDLMNPFEEMWIPPTPDGIAALRGGAFYTVAIQDLVRLPHGNVYRVTKFEEKSESTESGEATYRGIVLSLAADSPNRTIPLKEFARSVYLPIDGGGSYCGCSFRFWTENKDLKCRLSSPRIRFPDKSLGVPRIELTVRTGTVLPCCDVGFVVEETALPSPKNEHRGWVKISARPVALQTNIPRLRHDSTKPE